MKQRAFTLMVTAAMAMTLCVAGCGAFAAEADEDTADTAEAESEASDEAEDMPEVDEGFFVAGFFSDSISTYYKDADAVSDIVSGIGGMEFAAGAAASEDIADGIQADADLVAAVTYDAADVDFDTAGEYDVVYRVFIGAEDLQDYLEADEDADEDTADIDADYIDICIPGTVTITEADGEAEAEEADEETDDAEGATVAEVNEMTWTYDQAASIPDVVSGIGSIEYNNEDTEDAEDADEVYFDADAEIADAVLYDESRVDAEDPDAEDVAYFTYFDREALLAYMDEEGIDPADYPGLEDAYTEHIMVYYGPITELDLVGVLEGVVDHYVLQGAENIDYEYGVTYDGDVVTNVTADAGGVDLTKPGTYTVKYTVTVDTKALEEAADIEESSEGSADEEAAEDDADADAEETADDTEEAADEGSSEGAEAEDGVKDVVIEKEVTVVTPEEADELVGEGKTVWTDDNEEYGKTDEAAADTTAKEDTEVASNDTKADTADSSSAADTGSASSGSSSSGSAGSGSSSSGSGSGSSGSSGGSSGSDSSQHVHDWVAVYHDEVGHYESVKVKDAYDERVGAGYAYVCNNCGYATSDGADMTYHMLHGGPDGGYCGTGSCHTEDYYETVHHDAVYEDRYVVDQAAYTSYVCSGCGATK